MSGASIKIEVSDQEIAAGLQRLVDAGSDLGPAMRAIGEALLHSTQRRFEAKAGPDGGRWAPFAEETLRRMPARRKPPELLRDTNRLYSSIVFEAASEAVEVGTNVVYAAIHQFGGDIVIPERQGSATFETVAEGAGKAKDGRRVGSKLRFAKASTRAKTKETKSFTVPAHTVHIPARPYLGISEADKVEILAILADQVSVPGVSEVAP